MKLDGYQVTRRICEFSEVPIIMLTIKSKEVDLLRGFEAGADDYLTKPFSSKELLARLRAVLKRSQKGIGTSLETEIVCGDLRIDHAANGDDPRARSSPDPDGIQSVK